MHRPRLSLVGHEAVELLAVLVPPHAVGLGVVAVVAGQDRLGPLHDVARDGDGEDGGGRHGQAEGEAGEGGEEQEH